MLPSLLYKHHKDSAIFVLTGCAGICLFYWTTATDCWQVYLWTQFVLCKWSKMQLHDLFSGEYTRGREYLTETAGVNVCVYNWAGSGRMSFTVYIFCVLHVCVDKKTHRHKETQTYTCAQRGTHSWPYWQTWHVTSDCSPPVKIWSMMQLQWFGLLAFFPLSSSEGKAKRQKQNSVSHFQIFILSLTWFYT